MSIEIGYLHEDCINVLNVNVDGMSIDNAKKYVDSIKKELKEIDKNYKVLVLGKEWR